MIHFRRPLSAVLVVLTFVLQLPAAPKAKPQPGLRMTRIPYHGWPEAYALGNGTVEVVMVPAIGRIMQFRFTDEDDGPFFENRALDGRVARPSSEWANFGGDKSWPAPQADWGQLTGRDWPPPAAFDAMPNTARAFPGAVEMTTPVDASFGIRARRLVQLERDKPMLTVTTTYEKVSGVPVRVAIWVITQLKDPRRIFVPVPPHSIFPQGFVTTMGPGPYALQPGKDAFSFARHPQAEVKVGNDADTLFWVNDRWAVRIDSPRVSGTYAGRGSSVEVYTNSDRLPYVELEMVGPMSEMKVGDTISRTSTYRLYRTDGKSPEEMAKKILHLH